MSGYDANIFSENITCQEFNIQSEIDKLSTPNPQSIIITFYDLFALIEDVRRIESAYDIGWKAERVFYEKRIAELEGLLLRKNEEIERLKSVADDGLGEAEKIQPKTWLSLIDVIFTLHKSNKEGFSLLVDTFLHNKTLSTKSLGKLEGCGVYMKTNKNTRIGDITLRKVLEAFRGYIEHK